MKLAHFRGPVHALPVAMRDGRIMYLDLREVMCIPYLFTGEIWEEGGETAFVKRIIEPGDTAIDIGTNVGWYSSLLSEIVGSEGKVYGFEPGSKAFSLVSRTAEQYSQLKINQVALSDFEGESDFYVAGDGGQSSIKNPGNTVATEKCRVTTLDAFIAEHDISDISFIKCDAEGAELLIANGAKQLIGSEKPPIWMMEINEPMMRQFNSSGNQLFEFFRGVFSHDYKFYRINSQSEKLESITGPLDFRFDAVFVPSWQHFKIEAYKKGV